MEINTYIKRAFYVLIIVPIAIMLLGCGAQGPSQTSSRGSLVSISVTPANSSIAANTKQQFIATGTYANRSTENITHSVSWSSSNTGIVTISNASATKGLATASSATGSTTIVASYGGKSDSTHLSVTTATISSIEVTPDNPSIAKGATQQFTATGTFSDGTTQDITTSVTWGSMNPSVATISNDDGLFGLTTAVAVGTSSITASFRGCTDSTILTVTPAVLLSILVSPASPSIETGTTRQFIAIGTYSDNTMADITASVTWGSSNTSVAGISSNGLATSVSAGSTTIQAVLGNVSMNTTLIVTNAGHGTVTITWTPPTANTDETLLTDLSGYIVYYGTASRNYTAAYDVGNITSYTIPHLLPGTYYISAKAYNTSGVESDFSNEIVRTVQ